ncbi:MAG: tetratricopeptide repeat protein [Armatimonadota bacterium]|nr:tetratricopeptide repeat protein [Armatimonadota bacterium]
MPVCPICGTRVNEDANFCPECGARLTEEETSQAVRDMAQEYASQVLENPEDAAARYGLALARMYERKWGQAAEQFQQVLEQEPEYADAHANLAVCMARLGQPDRALEAIERAIDLDPGKKRYRRIRRQLTGRTH